jgi:hypothetical protein
MPSYNSFMGYDPVNEVALIVWTNLTISLDGKPTANSIMQKILDGFIRCRRFIRIEQMVSSLLANQRARMAIFVASAITRSDDTWPSTANQYQAHI